MRVTDGLWQQAAATPERPALVVEGRSWSYRELQAEVERMGNTLFQRGLRRGDRVVISLPNGAEYLTWFMAAARYGMVAVPVAESIAGAELAGLVELVRPGLVIGPGWAGASQASARAGGAGCPAEPFSAEVAPPLAGPEEIFYIGFSSGSTGRPKGVVRRHCAWVQSYAAATRAFSLRPGGRFLVPGPLHFSASLFAALHTLETGRTLILERRFSPRRVAALLQSGISGAFMVPTLYQAVVDEGGGPAPAADLCLISCGEKLRPTLRQALASRFPAARIYEYYGSSETGFISFLPPELAAQAESVGLPFPGVEARVAQGGVLHVRSAMMAAGYLGAGQAVVHFAGADGWVATGDLARIGPDGLIYLEGRADDAITSGGATVFPAEIEAVLARHPAVAEVAVVGRPDPVRGEEIVAAVVLRPGAEVSTAELRRACRAGLAPYKRPRAYLIMPDLPRTATGKVCRRRLREQLRG